MTDRFDRSKAHYCYADPSLYGILKENAKRMKSNPTEAEKTLWQYLNRSQLGKPFRRQFIIYDFIVDFICLPAKVVVELDGGYHTDPEQMVLDSLRSKKLETMGFKVLRFSNQDIFTGIDKVIEIIKNEII